MKDTQLSFKYRMYRFNIFLCLLRCHLMQSTLNFCIVIKYSTYSEKYTYNKSENPKDLLIEWNEIANTEIARKIKQYEER